MYLMIYPASIDRGPVRLCGCLENDKYNDQTPDLAEVKAASAHFDKLNTDTDQTREATR
jgi:hypothetical protein